MQSKAEFIKTAMRQAGIGRKKAEALWQSGFRYVPADAGRGSGDASRT